MPQSLLHRWRDNTIEDTPRRVMGIDFPNAVGLAAGLDKNAEYFNSLGQLGFGFVEVGTITPLAQPGNDKPRMFRLKTEQALINRMGFNNKGVAFLIDQVRQRTYRGVLGINIGKNLTTPLERAHEDYKTCLEQVYPLADYITVNISSPNTPGLRDLQLGESLQTLLGGIKQSQRELAQQHGKSVPVAVKISPDMAAEDIDGFCDAAVHNGIDGIIAGNTTLTRAGVEASQHAQENGGLSGKPLTTRARDTIARLAQRLQGEIPVIGCGGINSGADAAAHRQAGAALVQVYTGFIYHGPPLINDIRKATN
ncbi:MAG: quinone-dependent dihydroorotate dehydrogenase [Pseudomonadota bacterium]